MYRTEDGISVSKSYLTQMMCLKGEFWALEIVGVFTGKWWIPKGSLFWLVLSYNKHHLDILKAPALHIPSNYLQAIQHSNGKSLYVKQYIYRQYTNCLFFPIPSLKLLRESWESKNTSSPNATHPQEIACLVKGLIHISTSWNSPKSAPPTAPKKTSTKRGAWRSHRPVHSICPSWGPSHRRG